MLSTSPKLEYQSLTHIMKSSLLNIKLKGYEDLVKMAEMPFSQLVTPFGEDANDVIKNTRKKFPTVIANNCTDNCIKVNAVLNSLTPEQHDVLCNIYTQLANEDGSLTCIDAPPGTGKTFLISCLLTTYKNKSTYLVYTNKLKELMSRLYFNGRSENCCKFLMSMLDINYFKAKNLWNLKEHTLEEKCKEIEMLAEKTKPDSDLYILDEDSVVSPFFIFFMYCLYKIKKVHVVFIGDKFQQISINASKYHNRVNFDLIQHFSKVYTLHTKVRQMNDAKFIERLDKFVNMFEVGCTNKMTFDKKYIIYNMFEDNFHMKENFDAMYFAQYHVELKKRNGRYENYLKEKNIPYTKAYFHTSKNVVMDKLNLRKFNTHINLIIGNFYVFAPDRTRTFIVRLLEIGNNNLKVMNMDLDREQIVRRKVLSPSFVSEQLLTHLQNLGHGGLVQYPLKPMISTYHAAQGLTIQQTLIELNLDCSTLNSFYVGITRIRSLTQLSKIHTTELFNLFYTKRQNDEYYYRVVNFPESIDKLEFSFCENVNIFESCKTRNLKIHKNKYVKNKNINAEPTELMAYIKL